MSIWIGAASFVNRLISFCAAEFVDTVWMEKINLPFFVDSFFSWLPFIPADWLIFDQSPIISIADDKAVRNKLFAIICQSEGFIKTNLHYLFLVTNVWQTNLIENYMQILPFFYRNTQMELPMSRRRIFELISQIRQWCELGKFHKFLPLKDLLLPPINTSSFSNDKKLTIWMNNCDNYTQNNNEKLCYSIWKDLLWLCGKQKMNESTIICRQFEDLN